jgi:hypothetical protein
MHGMSDTGDDLTEAQCVLVEALSRRVWGLLHAREPEVVSTVLIDVLAAFLGQWGAGCSPAMRRRMQAEVMVSVAQVTFDILDLREAGKH